MDIEKKKKTEREDAMKNTPKKAKTDKKKVELKDLKAKDAGKDKGGASISTTTSSHKISKI